MASSTVTGREIEYEDEQERSIEELLASIDPEQDPTGRDRNIFRLLSLHLPVSEVSRMVDCCRQTVYRTIEKYGLQRERFSGVSEEELEEAVKDIKRNHPNAGYKMMDGHLKSRGIRVTRQRVRDMVKKVDATGVSERLTNTIQRRVYSVPSPNFMWHIDGNHKLIRWKLVTHAAVDGYSRVIVFMKCSPDNTAETVLSSFESATSRYGVPLHVRTDYGGENTLVWRFMEQQNTRSPVILGSSVHNERVERMWRDYNRLISTPIRDVFFHLEESGWLDPLNDTDLYCLHLVFMPLINRMVTQHTQAHNHHPVSTERNYTPHQLFEANKHLLGHYSEQNVNDGDMLRNHIDDSEITSVCVSLTIDSQLQLIHDQLCATIPANFDLTQSTEVYKRVIEKLGTCLS